jgi:hypothetical protein
MRVANMPATLKRGGEWVSNGVVHNARWERMVDKKGKAWHWGRNPFSGTAELDGLRVLMAFFNNYDLKHGQNTIVDRGQVQEYMESDLGATLGATGSRWPKASIRGDLEHYRESNFITKVTDKSVDFSAPSWPMLWGVVPTPPLPYNCITAPAVLVGKKRMPDIIGQRWIGKGIPREHVGWIAYLMSQLSGKQIRDAFRTVHYSPEEVEGFSLAVERRIHDLVEVGGRSAPAPQVTVTVGK